MFFSWLLPLLIYRNHKSWTEFQVTSQALAWLNSIYCFDHIINLLIDYAFSLNSLLLYIEKNRFYTKFHKTSFGNSISKYKKCLFQCITGSKGCLRKQIICLEKGLFQLCLEESEYYSIIYRIIYSGAFCRAQGTFQFLSWADAGSLLTSPCCAWASDWSDLVLVL